MLAEKRQTQRFHVSGLAQVQGETGGPPRECRITDISDGGARLYADDFEIADEFTLWLAGEVPVRRRCRVVWRLGPEFGAKFIDEQEPELASRVADSEQA